MDKPLSFERIFPDIYPNRRQVDFEEPDLIGLLVKSVFFHDNALLCRALVISGQRAKLNSTLCFRVHPLNPIVGYDLDMNRDENAPDDRWLEFQQDWSRHFAASPVRVKVVHDDIKREVSAQLFPLTTIELGLLYFQTVKEALTFGDFCPNRGTYLSREGNTPALCFGVMFGRVYFLPADKLGATVKPSDLIYDHRLSEAEAAAFDSKHVDNLYRVACLDIETVYDDKYKDRTLMPSSFDRSHPYCTENTVRELTARRLYLTNAYAAARTEVAGGIKNVSIPSIAIDMPGQKHEITCVSLVMLNTHIPKLNKQHHRKELFVLYNANKSGGLTPERDAELAQNAGIADSSRIRFRACSGELELIEGLLKMLLSHGIELLYVYNADFDVRVIRQRVFFHANDNNPAGNFDRTRRRALKNMWNALFVSDVDGEQRVCIGKPLHTLQFETVQHLDEYTVLLKEIGACLKKPYIGEKLKRVSELIDRFNKKKAKLGHFKVNSCGMNIVDLYRMAGVRDVKFSCSSMRLNEVAPFIIDKERKLLGKPPKDRHKISKLADVDYGRMDEMISRGGKSLFAVLVYNLVDSQLCARMAKVLKPVSALFHRCRTTLNIDVIVHGRGDNFGGFVQSIHTVQLPQLKFTVDNMRARAGPLGAKEACRWRVNNELFTNGDSWKGGSVCNPLTGLHYGNPGMGLEVSFDFSSMYPSIMCALNISPETTIPWPPRSFPHDLSDWVCYNWETEGFQFATLILKFDRKTGQFVRAPAVLASSVEYYLDKRAAFKERLKFPADDAARAYCKLQENECKIMANSFYGTAPYPCGPLISGHGRQQMAVVNSCVAKFFQYSSPVVYGDTDSVMVSVGYGPEADTERDVSDCSRHRKPDECDLNARDLRDFAGRARRAIEDKFTRSNEQIPDFLAYVKRALVADALDRMYMITKDNAVSPLIKASEVHECPRDDDDDDGGVGYPLYHADVPDRGLVEVTSAFVKNRRVNLEYENSCSVYCHVAKKTYVALSHATDGNRITSIEVKVRGLAAVKSVRSPCSSAVTDAFIACVMRGDCVKLETDKISCFTTCPWHRLVPGDKVLYPKNNIRFDDSGRWVDVDTADAALAVHSVHAIEIVPLDAGFSVTGVMLCATEGDRPVALVKMLYKDELYCMNHMISRSQPILRDLLACKTSEMIASKMGLGLFPWSTLIKSAKHHRFQEETRTRLKAGNGGSTRTTYVEIVKSQLDKITGLLVNPVECCEFHKCNPCEAALYKYPLDLKATDGCLKAMFGGHRLLCEISSFREPESVTGPLTSHPYQPLSMCYANSRVLTAHRVDSELVNRSGKLIAHCVIDYCLPRHMYSSTLGDCSVRRCKVHLQAKVASVRGRLSRATRTFNSIMNNCPEHIIPNVYGTVERQQLKRSRQSTARMPHEKRALCKRVLIEDMGLGPEAVYVNLCAQLRELLRECGDTVTTVGAEDTDAEDTDADRHHGRIQITLPVTLAKDLGVLDGTGRITVTANESRERIVVNLAGTLYQTLLTMQILDATSFDFVGVASSKTLTVMPLYCTDRDLLLAWLGAMKQKQWFWTETATGVERPRGGINHHNVVYHCTGCYEFYKKLHKLRVRHENIFRAVYDKEGQRKREFGRCILERVWIDATSV